MNRHKPEQWQDTMNRMRRLNPLAIVHKSVAESEIIALLGQLRAMRRRIARTSESVDGRKTSIFPVISAK
jgi:hypothetical protein